MNGLLSSESRIWVFCNRLNDPDLILIPEWVSKLGLQLEETEFFGFFLPWFRLSRQIPLKLVKSFATACSTLPWPKRTNCLPLHTPNQEKAMYSPENYLRDCIVYIFKCYQGENIYRASINAGELKLKGDRYPFVSHEDLEMKSRYEIISARFTRHHDGERIWGLLIRHAEEER